MFCTKKKKVNEQYLNDCRRVDISRITHTKLHEKNESTREVQQSASVLSVIFNNHTAQYRQTRGPCRHPETIIQLGQAPLVAQHQAKYKAT